MLHFRAFYFILCWNLVSISDSWVSPSVRLCLRPSTQYASISSTNRLLKVTTASPSRPNLLSLSMSLKPLSSSQVDILFPRSVTNEQWISYWGVNERERLQRVLESFLIAYGGAWMAWFLSFMAGGFVAGIVGSLLIFNWIYTPWLNANRRNLVLRAGNFYYGLFEAKIHSLKRIKRRGGKTIGAVSQEFLRIITEDEAGRNLEIITEWQGAYELLRVGMSLKTVIMSPRRDFSKLGSVTDNYVPECGIWVGDYPYLNKNEFKSLLVSERKRRIKRQQQQQQKQRVQVTDTVVINHENDSEVSRQQYDIDAYSNQEEYDAAMYESVSNKYNNDNNNNNNNKTMQRNRRSNSDSSATTESTELLAAPVNEDYFDDRLEMEINTDAISSSSSSSSSSDDGINTKRRKGNTDGSRSRYYKGNWEEKGNGNDDDGADV